jgi:hypothetical protein
MALDVMVDGWNIVTRMAMARQAQGYTFPWGKTKGSLRV